MGALDVLREELPKWWNDPQQQDFRDTVGFIVPTEPTDIALTAMGGPFGKATKAALGGLAALAYSPDAEAGNAAKAYALVQRLLSRARPGAQELAAKIFEKAPASFEAIDPAQLAHSIKYSQRMVPMTPAEFLGAARPMEYNQFDTDRIGALRNLLDRGTVGMYENVLEPDYIKRRNFRGFSETPFLSLTPESYLGVRNALDYVAREGVPKVIGHEGRHRMAAAQQLFGNSPIAVDLRAPDVRNYVNSQEFLNSPLWSVEGMDTAKMFKAPQGFAGGGLIKGLAKLLEKSPKAEADIAKKIIEEQGLWRYKGGLESLDNRRFPDAFYPFNKESLNVPGIEEYLTPEEINRLKGNYAEGGLVGGLSAWLENKKRVAKRNIRDLINSPDLFGEMMSTSTYHKRVQ